MTTPACDPPGRAQTRARLVWACWAGWTILVLWCYYVQIWRSLREPLTLMALAAAGARQALYCAVIGAAVIVAAVTFARNRLAWLTAAAVILLCALDRDTWMTALSTVRVPGFPAFGEAIGRAVTGMGAAGLVVLASFTLGRLLLVPLGLGDASRNERQMVALTLGFGAIAACCYALLCAGVYRPWPVVFVIGGVFLAGAALAVPYDGVPIMLKPAGMDKAWLALACVALSFALVGALAPESEYDALWYHLNFPDLWLQSGRPVDVVQEFPSLYPMTWELVYGTALAMGGIVAAKLLHFVCLLVLAGIVAMACRRYLPACSPYVAVALLVTAPTILWEATTAYNDLAVAMFASAGCYALARFVDTGHRPWLTVSGLEFGLAASTKHLGLVVLAVAAVALAWHSWRSGSYGRMIRNVARLGCLAVVLPLPWYIRTWRGSGNPFFPELYGIFGGGPASRWDETASQGLAAFKAHFGLGHDVAALVRLPWDVTVHSALFGGALGPLWLVLIPGCLLGRGSRRVAAVIAAGTLGYIAVWASPISSFQLRFLVPIGGALALLAADGWRRVMETGAGVRAARLAGIALVAVACLNLPPFMTLHEGDRVGYRGWLTHVMRTAPVAVVTGRETEAQYLARTVPSYRVWQYANARLPADGAVLTFTGGDNLYGRRVRYPHDSVLARPAVWTATNDLDVLRTLHGLRIDYVIFDRRILPELQSDRLPIAGERLQRACVTLYEDGRYRLCQLPSVFGQSGSPPISTTSGARARRDRADAAPAAGRHRPWRDAASLRAHGPGSDPRAGRRNTPACCAAPRAMRHRSRRRGRRTAGASASRSRAAATSARRPVTCCPHGAGSRRRSPRETRRGRDG